MFRNKSASTHQFSMVPRADIPRSSFRMEKTVKTSFDAGYLVPVYVDEVLPGDTFNLRMTAFGRLATPLVPVMDNLYLETFFFFVPNRLVWSNWKKFMGEQTNPGDSTSYTIPQVNSNAGGFAANSVYDYMGCPVVGQVTGGQDANVNALPLRAYLLIWNEWFRDQNLQNSATVPLGDGPDSVSSYGLLRRGKRHDYFTSCLPWTQKGTATSLLTGSATVKTNASALYTGTHDRVTWLRADNGGTPQGTMSIFGGRGSVDDQAQGVEQYGVYPSNMYADLSTATATTINTLRQAFQIQRLMERDARGGTRYTEIIRAHFGVVSPDARLQRPEYLGGGSTPIHINPVQQTSGTGLTGQTTPQGNLAAFGTTLAREHGFSQSFTEHGYIIGLANVRADLTYQQGLRRMWSRSTKYDFYFPAFANLGEQAVLKKEIYYTGNPTNDDVVFGYQERWAEYRYNPNEITGLLRSCATGSLDVWHLAQDFGSSPTLDSTFIQDTPPLSRILAVGAGADGQQILLDCFFDIQAARPMPMYSVPGMIDHF